MRKLRPRSVAAALLAGSLAGCAGPAPPHKAGALLSAVASGEGKCRRPCESEPSAKIREEAKKKAKKSAASTAREEKPPKTAEGGKKAEPLGACSTYQFLGGAGCEISTKRKCHDRPIAVEWREGGVCIGWPPG